MATTLTSHFWAPGACVLVGLFSRRPPTLRRQRLARTASGLLASLAVALGSGSCETVHAQDLASGTPAVRIRDTLGEGSSYTTAESWLQVSYVVQLDGTVADVIIEDSFGPTSATRVWVRELLKWRFQPASWMSVPVRQANREGLIKDVSDGRQAVRTGMRSDIDAVREMAAQAKWDAARSELDALQQRRGLTLYEFAFLSYLRGDLEARQSRFQEAAFYLRRATGLGAQYLGNQAYYDALYARLRAEVGAGMHADALNTIQEMKANPRYDPNTGISNVERQLVEVAVSGDIYSTAATIVERVGRPEPFWDQHILRRSLGFADIKGTLTSFELRCQRRHLVDTPSEGKRLDLQAQWGACRVYVYGEVGSAFQLHEYPLARE